MAPQLPAPPPLRRRNRQPTVARVVVDDLRGDVGFVSEDIWRDVFGFKKDADGDARNSLADGNEEPEDEPLPPTLHLAVSPLAPAATTKKWTILPVTLLPTSSQFPSLPPSTVLVPERVNLGFPSPAGAAGKKSLGVLIAAVNPAPLDTVLVVVHVPRSVAVPESDQDLEDRVKDALGKLRIVHSGEELALNYGRGHGHVGRTAKIALCEPVDQGYLRPDTKVVIVKEYLRKRRRRGGSDAGGVIFGGDVTIDGPDGAANIDGEDEDMDDLEFDDENMLELSTFLTPPATSAGVSFPSVSSTPSYMRNGLQSPNSTVSAASSTSGRTFKPQPLTAPVPPGLLHPKPKELEDEEARVYVKVGDLARLGCFSGDWVRIAMISHNQEAVTSSPLRTAAESVARSQLLGHYRSHSHSRPINGTRAIDLRDAAKSEEPETTGGRPVKVYSLPDGWLPPEKHARNDKGKANGTVHSGSGRIVYLSPILLANLTSCSSTLPGLLLTPINASISPNANASLTFPPAAKEVNLLRIASPTTTDRALQPSLLLQLKSYFETCRRLVKVGDLIAVSIDDVLARSLNADTGEDSIAEELLASEGSGRKSCVAWFRVGNVVSSATAEPSAPDRSPGLRRTDSAEANEEDVWGGVVSVDPATTRMAQSGSDKRKVPPTLASTWEHFLGMRPPPLRQAVAERKSPHLVVPRRFANPAQRRLRELIAASTSPRAIQLDLHPIAILLHSTQRAIGKRTLATQAAADVGVHTFHIDAYDILADGGEADSKTEAFLRARVDRALSCGRETTALLLSHVEALTAGRISQVLHDVIGQLKVVVATTTEVDRLSEAVRNLFTHELEVGAPDEKERVALLEAIVDDKGITLGRDVDLAGVAVKTAALVAGDLADVVDRAVAVRQSRVKALEKRLRKFPPLTPRARPTVHDLVLSGGDAVTAVCKTDFDAAVEAARRNFSDAIGAPRIPNVSWDDVGGLANVKSAVMETIQLPLERPELFAAGMKKRSGILFYGPPGTGKTLLAKAIATEFSLNFFSIKGPELLNMYIGESEANVRRVFQRARDARPCVVFFDELDSVAPKRGNQGDSGGVMDRIVSQLLAELDGMSEGKQGSGDVFVIGATNRPDLLDPALLRPGRFDKMLYLGVSDTHEKQLTILEALTRKFTLHPHLSLRAVAETLPFTYTGADLYALCSDAMLKAISRQAEHVDARIRALDRPVSTAWFFDHLATEEDVTVVVRNEDFEDARRELVGSVSAKELEHYQRVRAQFEQPEETKEGKGKGKGVVGEVGVGALRINGEADVKGKGKGKGKAVDYEESYGPATGVSGSGSAGGIGTMHDDTTADDAEDLYGD